jgi:scyllo-inositol 2-dehydrogenase (NADP+)
MADLRVAVVGYGLAGRSFHAPLIEATAGLALAAVVSANPVRRQQLAAEHPQARPASSTAELWTGDPPDLVVVAAPNRAHATVALEAITHGVPVVVDKPLAVTAGEAEELLAEAERTGVLLTVFQNRRWDTDQLTLRRLVEEGALGEINRYESRFERWRPELEPGKWRETAAPEEGGGVLLDLGSHLVDQALTLFGPARHVFAEIASRRGAPGDDDVFIALEHDGGTLSHLHASAVTPSVGPRLRVQGSRAGFLVSGLDPQEAALRAGKRPDTVEEWGMPPDFEHGRFVAGDHSVPVPPVPGDWRRFYELLRDALVEGAPPPVDPRDAVATLRVLEAAARSSAERGVVSL